MALLPASEFADGDIGKLDRAAVVLQSNGAFAGQAGKFGFFNDLLIIEKHRDLITFDGNQKTVPLADRFVSPHLGRAGSTDRKRHLGIVAVAINFTRANGPTPNVDLALLIAAQIDPTVPAGFGGRLDAAPLAIKLIGAIGVDDRGGSFAAFVLPAPVHLEDKVFVTFGCPEMGIGRGAFAIVNEGTVLPADLPVWFVGIGQLPSVEVDAVKERGKPEGLGAGLRGRGLANGRGAPGDLYAVVQIDVPATLTERERELFAALAKDSSFHPRATAPGAPS